MVKLLKICNFNINVFLKLSNIFLLLMEFKNASTNNCFKTLVLSSLYPLDNKSLEEIKVGVLLRSIL